MFGIGAEKIEWENEKGEARDENKEERRETGSIRIKQLSHVVYLAKWCMSIAF